MGADYLFYVKTIETHAHAFLPLNISAVGSGFKETSCNKTLTNFESFIHQRLLRFDVM